MILTIDDLKNQNCTIMKLASECKVLFNGEEINHVVGVDTVKGIVTVNVFGYDGKALYNPVTGEVLTETLTGKVELIHPLFKGCHAK